MTAPATFTDAAVSRRVIGCDVGKKTITVFDTATGRTTELANNAETLLAFAQGLPPDCLVVCEATGGYEAALLLATAAASVPAHRADARKVKAFIRSLGRLGKSDSIDARGLTRYGQERHAELPRWQPADRVREDLRTLIRLRTQLVKQRAALTNQIKAPGGEIAKKHLGALRDAACQQIAAIEADIRALIERDPAAAAVVAIIKDIPGCGPLTAVTVTALMPELGAMSGRQAASLAGLAPHPHQSGQRDGYRRTRGGRPEVKRALFMAAMAARNHNPTLKVVYERLLQNGKKPILAITALMRKLITIINARIRDALQMPTPKLS
jgi:transposase